MNDDKFPWYLLRRWMFTALLAAVLILTIIWIARGIAAGVEREHQQMDQWSRDATNPINICIAKGGIPILDKWDGSLARCDFPPKVVAT